MKLKVIGTGSSGNAYLLETEQEALLIECGVNIKEIKQAIDFNVSKIVGCIVSHRHGDHAKSINEIMKLGIETYTLNDVFKHTGFSLVSKLGNEISERQTFKIGNFKILAFDVKHDVPCLGFLIEHEECGRVLFLTDTYYCKYTFPGLNNILIEANYSKEIIDKKYGPDSDKEFLRNRILKSHFSLENCIDMLKANDLSAVNNIVLIHLSDTNSNEKQFKEAVFNATQKNVSVASNGMVIDFNKTPF